MDRSPATLQRPGDPCAIVIFGVRGDLTKRKLLPALYDLRCNGLLPREFAIVGVGRREMDDAGLRDELGRELRTFATRPVAEEVWADFRERLHYVRGGVEDPATYRTLAGRLAELDREHHTGGNALFYLATPPGEFAELARNLGSAGLVREEDGAWRRVVVEKPFGRDLDSARALNEVLRKAMREDQVFRIDHYLGKETVQNILVFRFANGIFEPVWNRRYIDHVQLTVAEDIGVEGRGAFYEQAGALRDVIQNHMFQLLALMAMEPPISFRADDVRDEKLKALRSIRPMKPEEVLQRAVRGQYGEGRAEAVAVPAYRSEPSVSPESRVETYGALELLVENWRWAGVPFYLRSGKRLAKRATQIVIEFKRAPLLLFRQVSLEGIEPNRLVLHIQPNEGITLQMKAKIPGPSIQMKAVDLHFNYRDLGDTSAATGYETLLYDCMVGDSTLFHRADMVDAAWEIATPILDVWESLPPRDFPNYAPGTWGPATADELIRREGRRWVNPD